MSKKIVCHKIKVVNFGGAFMKIDKGTIDNLLKLNDEQLWGVIKIMLSRSGGDYFKSIEKPKDMSKLRDTLSKLTDSDIARALELLKKGKNNG